jgi:hypothetical protein
LAEVLNIFIFDFRAGSGFGARAPIRLGRPGVG